MTAKFDWQHCGCTKCDDSNYIDETIPQATPVWNRPTPWAVRCIRHGRVFLSHHEYNRQMNSANARWECPICSVSYYDGFSEAQFDDDNYNEAMMEMEDAYLGT